VRLFPWLRTHRTAPPHDNLGLMPARFVPLLYFALAHLSLATAGAMLATDPVGLGASFYQPRMLAVVHLVTLGFLSAAILGSLYLVGPLALRMRLPASPLDHAGFWAFALGVSGLIGHFWLDAPRGMAWAAALTILGMGQPVIRVLRELPAARLPPEVKAPIAFALVNLLLAGLYGLLLGLNKLTPLLPGLHLRSVFAHAHLAAVGWGLMIVIGVGSRMIPMVLPAAMPRGRVVWAASLLTELGVLSLVVAIPLGGTVAGVAALLVAAGILAFLSRLIFMLRHRRAAPRELRQPDLGVLHALQAVVYLVLTASLGVWLAWAAPSGVSGRRFLVYGVFGLLGFLCQMVVGVASRLLPLAFWLWGFADRDFKMTMPPLHRAPSYALQVTVFALWSGGVPGLAAGLGLGLPWLTRLGAIGLTLATVANALSIAVMLARLWKRPARSADVA